MKTPKKLKASHATRTPIWVGASKGVVFALFIEREGANIDTVADVNPAKHGKYLPGTGCHERKLSRGSQILDYATIQLFHGGP
jgi:hypothetical protein